MKRIAALLMMSFCLAVFPAKAERYYFFEHIKATDGLPSNTIYCSIQDKSGFMWIGTRDGLCRYDGHSFLRIDEMVPSLGMSGMVMSIAEDDMNRIWFSTSNGIYHYNTVTEESGTLGIPEKSGCMDIHADAKGNVWFAAKLSLYRYDTTNSGIHSYSIGDSRPVMVTSDSLGMIWVLGEDGSVYIYDRLKDTFKRQPLGYKVKNIESVEDGGMLVATFNDEVILLDCLTLKGDTIFSGNGKIVQCMQEARKGVFWIGTDSGLFIRRAESDYFGSAVHDEGTPGSVSADYITSIDKDRSGNLWIGTYYTGLNIWKDRGDEMSVYFPNPSDNSLKGKIVRSIVSDQYGIVWFCTEDGYLNRLDPQIHQMRSFELSKGMNMHDLIMDGDRMWICTFGNGIYEFDVRTEKVVKKHSFPVNGASTGIKTAEGHIYIGTTYGLYRFNREDSSFTKIQAAENDFVHCLYQDASGILWIGTYGNGIRCLDRQENQIAHINPQNDEKGLTSRFITSFLEDSQHRMWVTTEGGGVCYTEPGYRINDLKFKSIGRAEGLTANVTCGLAEDIDGTMWVSTTNGIANISGKDLSITAVLNYMNKVAGYQYSYGAVHTTDNGVLYFGNTEGMIAVTPAKMKTTKDYPLSISSVKAVSSRKIIKLNTHDKGDGIKVRYRDASAITFNYVIPEYSSRNILYNYEVSRGKHVMFSGNTYETNLTFTKLRPGRYTFKIGVVGNDDPQSTKSISMKILPHLLLGPLAFTIYFIILASLTVAAIMVLEGKRKRDKARNMTKLTDRKEKELYNAKINYFTNITHEIRTPLTLIKMPLDKLIAKGAYTPESEKDLRTIQANTDRLLSLTNQLLDMRKMEQNEIKLSCIKEDICDIVRKSARYFEQMAQDQHITLTTVIPDTPIYVMCAKDSVVTIVSNLLSNAVKYGKDAIVVKVSASEDYETIYVRVDSNGEHIPEADKEKIFNIFFQREENKMNGRVSQGTGLGLPYARTLANMHNGKLYLDMDVREMNSFVLELPARQEDHISPEPAKPSEKKEKANPGFDSSKHTVLIAEDSEEMREYLADELSEKYNVFAAANGSDALEIIRQEKIDLVVSDIMMPVMDGCELCNHIKNDSDLSHVPVILLTAAIGVEKRIETLEIGADGYIEKPFPIELLMSNISNLFKNREISYKQFMSKPLTHYNSVTASKVDEEYMDKLHDFIMKHISEPDLNIENLTIQLGTSKSSLYRKLKANTGLSINEYIRVCRLKQAAELLSSQKYKINEVAFMTGFSSPSYFATCFQKQFGISPSEFVKNLGQ